MLKGMNNIREFNVQGKVKLTLINTDSVGN